MNTQRRSIITAAAATLLGACSSTPTRPSLNALGIYAAGPGSAFLPYAQGLAAFLSAAGLNTTALESKGSIENLSKVDAEPGNLGTAFLGTAFEAVTGSGSWTGGKKLTNVRALFPMYETSFQMVALRASGLATLSSLAGKKVGVGPAGGPAESYFKGLAEAVGLSAQTVTGTPAALAADLLGGRIDALWQGASVPIPVLKQIADGSDATVFGLRADEQAAMLKRFAFLSPATVPANTYRNQNQALNSVAAWNFVVAHLGMSEADAYWITRTVLGASDPKLIHASAGPTRAANAGNNTVVPFHPGALRYYREQGITGLR
jgi:uncharacterized protein